MAAKFRVHKSLLNKAYACLRSPIVNHPLPDRVDSYTALLQGLITAYKESTPEEKQQLSREYGYSIPELEEAIKRGAVWKSKVGNSYNQVLNARQGLFTQQKLQSDYKMLNGTRLKKLKGKRS